MKSYHAEELFDENGTLTRELAELAPTGNRRMGANPHANGGVLLKDLRMPNFRDYAIDVPKPGAAKAEATRVLGPDPARKLPLGGDEQPERVLGGAGVMQAPRVAQRRAGRNQAHEVLVPGGEGLDHAHARLPFEHLGQRLAVAPREDVYRIPQAREVAGDSKPRPR